MPKNNKLPRKDFPMNIKFGEDPNTGFKNNLKNITVELTIFPKYEDIVDGCIGFSNATWLDKPLCPDLPSCNMGKLEKMKVMYHIAQMKILPTTLEQIKVTFLIGGISLQEVTHILRYRRAVFSAECTGDKFLHDKDFVVPTAIQNTKDFNERYETICKLAKELYCDMVNSEIVTTQDARYILPRSMETFYYMSMTLKDAIQFCKDRVDKQIQPQSDNVIAYYMMCELVKVYPFLLGVFNKDFIHRKSEFYVKTARQYRATNWFKPDNDSDCFEYNESDFVYDKPRDSYIGYGEDLKDEFSKILISVENYLEVEEKKFFNKYIKEYLQSDLSAWELGWLKDL